MRSIQTLDDDIVKIIMGDTVSVSILMSDEANAECERHINESTRWFSASGKPDTGFLYMEPIAMWNFTRDP